jgi:hypothetical protein
MNRLLWFIVFLYFYRKGCNVMTSKITFRIKLYKELQIRTHICL